jgi:hypothetical protein
MHFRKYNMLEAYDWVPDEEQLWMWNSQQGQESSIWELFPPSAKWLEGEGEHSPQPNTIIIKKDWLYLQSNIHFHGMVLH